MQNEEKIQTTTYPRREFIKNLTICSGGFFVLGSYGFSFTRDDKTDKLYSIIVDFDKCTGCRTCETACSAYNNKINVEGEILNGIGNPRLSNIRVHNYNPDVDVPVTCANCSDAPCIAICPVDPDPENGRRALYRDEVSKTIKVDLERCLGCTLCAKACKEQRSGVLVLNEKTKKPERICTHCDGDPQCVKFCPYGTLSYQEIDVKNKYKGMSPDEIAKDLFKHFYSIKTK